MLAYSQWLESQVDGTDRLGRIVPPERNYPFRQSDLAA